jgi:geranylgeranyl diphosphate synthase type II
MPVDVKSLIQEGADLTDRALEALLPSADTVPNSIHAAMRHSTFAGGKRLRPVLAMQAAVAISGAVPKGIENLGAAIEMLHTYSLIHDDLPALDNDDLRRGKPTCHKAFGEAIAILAGDALQTQAFEVLAGLECPRRRRYRSSG